jgi:Putative phage abortive infection protein
MSEEHQIKGPYGFTKEEWRFVILIILLTLAGIAVHWFWIPLVEWRYGSRASKDLAEFGESYIIFHSFFDMLAWAVVITALVLQFRDARERDRQFARQMEAQGFQSVFFPYLTLFQTYVENVECGSLQGRRVFTEWLTLIRGSHPSRMERLCDDYGATIEYYHKHLETLLRFILSSGISSSEKKKYLSLLHSQLSGDELAVIMQYCNCEADTDNERKRRRERFKSVLDHVRKECGEKQGNFLKPDFLVEDGSEAD